MSANPSNGSRGLFDDLIAGFDEVKAFARGGRPLRRTVFPESDDDEISEAVTDRRPPEYVVLFQPGPARWSAIVPDLPGCAATGDTFEQVEARITAEMRRYLQTLEQMGRSAPPPSTRTRSIRVPE